MFLFSFALFGGKGECKQEFRHTKKNTQPQAEKTRTGTLVCVCGRMCASLFGKRREAALYYTITIVIHTCIRERVCSLRCLVHMLIGGQRGRLSAGHWPLRSDSRQ